MITVHHDIGFLLLVVLGSFAVVPAIGGAFLRLACRIVKVRGATYVRCWMAYLVAYVAASLVGTVLLLVVKDAASVPWWLVAAIFGLALGVHLVVVPLVLRSGLGKGLLAHAMAMAMYAIVLAMALTPAVLHARTTGRRAMLKVDLHSIGRSINLYAQESNEKLPPTLEALQQAGYPIVLSPGRHLKDITYIGDYIRDKHGRVASERGMRRMALDAPWGSPMLWARSDDFDDDEIVVCFRDGSVHILSREEFTQGRTRFLTDLGLE